MSIDMDPFAAVANTATSLGDRSSCAVINENNILDGDEDVSPDTITLDVTAQGIPPYNDNGTPSDFSDDFGGIIGYQFRLHYNELALALESADHGFLLTANSNSSLFDGSDATPDADGNGSWTAFVLDTAPPPIESGSGVLARLAISSKAGSSRGLYEVKLVNDPTYVGSAAHVDAGGNGYTPDSVNSGFISMDRGRSCPPPAILCAADRQGDGRKAPRGLCKE